LRSKDRSEGRSDGRSNGRSNARSDRGSNGRGDGRGERRSEDEYGSETETVSGGVERHTSLITRHLKDIGESATGVVVEQVVGIVWIGNSRLATTEIVRVQESRAHCTLSARAHDDGRDGEHIPAVMYGQFTGNEGEKRSP
jgi:hypothetical protein